MSGKRIQNLWIDNNEPSQTNVVWIRPNQGIFYYVNGDWIPINFSSITKQLVAGTNIGGIIVGDTFDIGTPVEIILRKLLLADEGNYNYSSPVVGIGRVGYMRVS